MILAAAAADRKLIEHAQPRGGFSRVQNSGFGPGNGCYKFPRERRDAAQPLQQIQDHALAGKNDPCIVANDGDRLALVQPHAIENFGMTGDLVMRNYSAIECGIDVENTCNAAEPGENAILFRQYGARGALVGIDAGVAGRIACRPVLEQRILQHRGNAPAIPVHKSSCQWPVASYKLNRVYRELLYSPAAQFTQLAFRFLTQHRQFMLLLFQAFHDVRRSLRQELLITELAL